MLAHVIVPFIIYVSSCIAQPPPPPHHDPIAFLMTSPETKAYSHLSKGHRFALPFFKSCSEQARQQFLDIIKDGSVIEEVMQEKVNHWMAAQDQACQDSVKEVRENMKEFQQKFETAFESSTTFSPGLKDALEKIKTIGDQTGLTVQEKVDQAKEIYDALSETEKQEMGAFIHSILPQHLGHRSSQTDNKVHMSN